MNKKVISATPEELKHALEDMRSQGLCIFSVDFKPIKYDYTIKYYKKETEEWRDIPGYVGVYQISETGRIRSVRIKELTHGQQVILCHKGKRRTHTVSKLYELAFGKAL